MIDDIERLKKDNKELQKEVDYYKHEYFSACDLLENLDEQLNYACSILANICTELSEFSEITCPHRCKNMPCNNECNTVNGWRKRIEEEVKRIG